MSVVDGEIVLRERSRAETASSSSSYQTCETLGSFVGADLLARASMTPVTGGCSSTTGTPTCGVPVRLRWAGAGIAGGPDAAGASEADDVAGTGTGTGTGAGAAGAGAAGGGAGGAGAAPPGACGASAGAGATG